MGGLAARRAGGFPGGGPPMSLNGTTGTGGPPGGGIAGRRPKPGLKLSDIGGPGASPADGAPGSGAPSSSGAANRSLGGTLKAPGRLANAPKGGLMSSAFSEFSDVM